MDPRGWPAGMPLALGVGLAGVFAATAGAYDGGVVLLCIAALLWWWAAYGEDL